MKFQKARKPEDRKAGEPEGQKSGKPDNPRVDTLELKLLRYQYGIAELGTEFFAIKKSGLLDLWPSGILVLRLSRFLAFCSKSRIRWRSAD